MRFEKWQALGNDYVIVERDALPWELTPERVRRICAAALRDRLRRDPAARAGDRPELRRRAADLQPRRLGGRALRATARARRCSTCASHGWTDEDEFSILTKAGEVTPTITGPRHGAMAIGRASLTSDDFPSGARDGTGTLESAGREWGFQHVNVGNPQCVIEVGDGLEELDLARSGPRSSEHATCSPTAPTCRSSGRRRLDRAGPDLRARGGGDALLRNRRQRSRGRRVPARRARARSPSSSTAAS